MLRRRCASFSLSYYRALTDALDRSLRPQLDLDRPPSLALDAYPPTLPPLDSRPARDGYNDLYGDGRARDRRRRSRRLGRKQEREEVPARSALSARRDLGHADIPRAFRTHADPPSASSASCSLRAFSERRDLLK